MNIDFLKVAYLNMLYSSNLLPVITKPTRITATLIDHDQIIPGFVTTDISDHLPTFCFIRRQIARLKPKRFFRDCSNFDSEIYLNDIKSADWSSILNSPTDFHPKASSFVEKLKVFQNYLVKVSDIHAHTIPDVPQILTFMYHV